MSIKDMHFERHSASHFGIVFYESLNQLLIVFSLVISQKAVNYGNETVPSRVLLPAQLLREFVTLYDFLYLWSDEDTCIYFSLRQLWKEILEVDLKAADSLSR